MLDPRTRRGPAVGATVWDSITLRQAAPLIELFKERIAGIVRDATAPRIMARTRQAHLCKLTATVAEFETIRLLFGLTCKPFALPTSAHLSAAQAANISAVNSKRFALATLRRESAQKIAVEKAAAQALQHDRDLALPGGPLDLWRRGEVNDLGAACEAAIPGARISYPALRLVHPDALTPQVETSDGPVVDAADARRVLALLPRLIGRLNETDHGATVGHFRGMTATAGYLVIGCHRIPWFEVRAFCAFVGWELPAGTPPMPGIAADALATA